MTFVPLTCHPNPKSVLIIGGGDGGVAREVAKYPTVEKIVQCEIDAKVVEVSKQFLPFMASGFDSPKLTLHIGDGLDFVSKSEKEFDVIITDSSDPIGKDSFSFNQTSIYLNCLLHNLFCANRACWKFVWREILQSVRESVASGRNNLLSRGKYVVSLQNHQNHAWFLRYNVPQSELRIHLHSDLSWRANWISFM